MAYDLTYRSSASAVNVGTGVNVTLPAGTADGDVLTAFVLTSSNLNSFYWLEGTDATGRSLVGDFGYMGGDSTISIYQRIAASEPASYNFGTEWAINAALPGPGANVVVYLVAWQQGTLDPATETMPTADGPQWYDPLPFTSDVRPSPIGLTDTSAFVNDGVRAFSSPIVSGFGTIGGSQTGGVYAPPTFGAYTTTATQIGAEFVTPEITFAPTTHKVRWAPLAIGTSGAYAYTATLVGGSGDLDFVAYSVTEPVFSAQPFVSYTNPPLASDSGLTYEKRHVTAKALPYDLNTGMLRGV